MHDPDQLHPPIDLIAGLRTQKLELQPALRAAPQPLGNVVDDLLGLQMRVIPPAMPTTTPLLTPPRLGHTRTRRIRHPARLPAIPTRRIPTRRVRVRTRTRPRLLRRLTEQDPRQHRDLLSQLRHPSLSRLSPNLSHPHALLPRHHVIDSGIITQDRGRHTA
jgi:hypothetical protein